MQLITMKKFSQSPEVSFTKIHTRHNVNVICPHDMLQELDVEPFCCGDVVAWLGPIGPNID